MKKLIELFNKKYGHIYGVIDDSIDNEDVFKAYKIIKTLCADDIEIMELLDRIKLPSPKTAKESIEKINAEHVSGEGLDDLIKYVDDNFPHYNETLIYEIHGEDFNYLMNNSYFNINALVLDETKLYVGKVKTYIDDTEEFSFELVYDKENDILIDEISETYISNHKSFDGTNFIEDENSAVISFFITTMEAISEVNGYLKLYEVDKVELDNNCLSNDVIIKSSLTVGTRMGDVGEYSVAEGEGVTASGNLSHAEGGYTTASGDLSHAEGSYTESSGYFSHAEGNGAISSGECSHAEGKDTISSGGASHAEGRNTIALGDSSHAEGNSTEALSANQHVQGKFNIKDTTGTYAHIVGNGTSNGARSNAHTLDWNGNAWYAGKLTQEGTPTEDKDLATKKYVDNNMCNKNNINNFYKEPMELFNINLVTDENGHIVNTSDFDYIRLSTNGYGVGAYKNLPMTEEYEKYLTNIKNLIDVRLKSNDEVIYEDLNRSAGGTLPVNIYYPASRDLPCIQFQVRTNYTYDTVNNKYIVSKGNMCVFIGIIRDEATQNSYVSTTINATVNLKETNSENISSFVTLKESEQGYGLVPTNHSSDIYTGKYTMNLNSKSAPSYSYVVGSNTFGNTQGEIECSGHLSVFGGNDILMISYGAIYGIQNSIKAHRSGAGMWGVSVFGNNITFNEAKDNKASYLLMCGDHLTATKSGAYIGRYATIPDTEMFAVCNGTSSEEKILLSVNRDTGAVTSISTPTEDTHLTTKKYVDDIDTAVREYVDNKTASIDTTINNPLPVNGSLNLTTSKFQTTTLATDTEVILPTVEGYTEIHLFFLGISGTNILDTNVAWNNKPTIEDNKKYEFIYTYVNSEIGWLGKAVVYTV